MAENEAKKRLSLKIQGAVQGVGFRPFVYKLATELNLTGWVSNSSEGVNIEVEGKPSLLKTFEERLVSEKPSLSIISHIDSHQLSPQGDDYFSIKESVKGEKTTVILPDLATCSECLQEIFNPSNRRYQYPFTNCTHCGPRYSIIEGIPYDRQNTTMKAFAMCTYCRQEYQDPLNRRFHAQPNACADCGPQVQLWDQKGEIIANHHQAIAETAIQIRQGKIVAFKGLGGFQLIVDAHNQDAVKLLRQRKKRPQKPFALMYPSLELVREDCEVNELEQELLLSPQSPIVLLLQKSSVRLKEYFREVAPNNPYLGVMLPYTPLHHLLFAELNLNGPLVVTSANLSDEPICIDNQEALTSLAGIADLFLVHNRPIARPIDDSVARILADQVMILRRARGYAPLPIRLANNSPQPPILAVGAQLKNTVAIAKDKQIFISQHIGDLETLKAYQNFNRVIHSLNNLYDFQPELIACDLHPNYNSTNYANLQKLPRKSVQHHLAHVLSCLVENQLNTPVLGVAWDGTGYGIDGTIWGGEFLLIKENKWQRIAYFRTFKLPGGAKAIKEPWRTALGLLAEIDIDLNLIPEQLANHFSKQELAIIKSMLAKNINSPVTSSVGRLFDGVASILGIQKQVSFEGEAAMQLEFTAMKVKTQSCYPFELLFDLSAPIIIDWIGIIKAILDDLKRGESLTIIAAKFQNTLVEIIIAIATRFNVKQVVLTGGCFQNKYLLDRSISKLKESNFSPYWNQKIPTNDGGIALGQILGVNYQFVAEKFLLSAKAQSGK
jgi:hydrogenase maturation protein HypF